MPTLEDRLDNAERYIRKILLKDKDPELTAMCHLIAPVGGRDVIVGCPWRNDTEKQLVFRELCRMSREMNAVAAVFMGEAWMTATPPGVDLDIPPSQSPDRIEIVFAIVTNGSTTIGRQLKVIRERPDGPIIDLVRDEMPHTQLGGRLLDGLIEHRGTTH